MEETPEIITRNAEEKAKDIKIDNACDSKANPTYRSLAFLNQRSQQMEQKIKQRNILTESAD